MPGPMSRPDGYKETDAERKERGRILKEGKRPVSTGKTAAKKK